MKNLLLLLTTLLVLFAGCKKDDEQLLLEANLKQGWKLTAERINGIETDLVQIPIPELMYFADQSLCYLATPVFFKNEWKYNDLRTAWSYDYTYTILNIAGMLPATIYIDVLTNNSLEIHYYKFNDSGDLDRIEKSFSPVQVEIEDLKIRIKE